TYQTKDDLLFALKVQPKLDAPPPRPRDYLVLVDTSASQFGAPLIAARQLAEHLVEQAGDDDRVALWIVNTPDKKFTRSLTRGFRPVKKDAKDLEDALAELKKEYPAGDTDLKNGLDQAIKAFEKAPEDGRQRVLLFLGDGMSLHNPIGDAERAELCEKMVQ